MTKRLFGHVLENPAQFARLFWRYISSGSSQAISRSLFPFAFVNVRVPRTVSIEFTNACNLRCYYCDATQSAVRRRVGLMSDGTALRIGTQLRGSGVHKLKIIGAGEPTLHPNFDMLLREFRQVAAVITIRTNGHCDDDRKLKAMVQNTDIIEVSVASSEEREFARDRTGGKLSTVLSFLRRLAELRGRNQWPMIQTVVMVHPSYCHHLKEIQQYWKRRADSVSAQRVGDYFDIRQDLFPINREDSEFKRCTDVFNHMNIHWDGDVPLCTATEYRHGKRGLLVGNINVSSLEELWTSELLGRYRRAHLALRPNDAPGCAACPYVC